MDPCDVLLASEKSMHFWCGPGETISYTLLSALLSIASKTVTCEELEARMAHELSVCLKCVRVFHLTLSYSDADSLGLEEEDFGVLCRFLEENAHRRVSKELEAGLSADKKWSPSLTNAFLEVLNYTSLLRSAMLFSTTENFIVSLLDANVSIPKKTKFAGVYMLCASSVSRVRNWAEQYVCNCESQGTILTVVEVEDVLDRALDVLMDAVQGQRIVDGRHAVLGSSQGGLVVFESEHFYSALWFLLERVSSDMKKCYATNYSSRFAFLLRVVFSRVDEKVVCGEQPLKSLCALLKACCKTGSEAVVSPEDLWRGPDCLEFRDAIDMLMDKACSSYESLPIGGMKSLIQCFLWICLCAPPEERLEAQDRIIQFLLVGEMASIADGAFIMDAQEQVLYIVAQGAKEGFSAVKTEGLWAHPLVSMATAQNATRNAISIVTGLVKQLQPKESPDKIPVFMKLWTAVLSCRGNVPSVIHVALWHCHSKMTIKGSFLVDALRNVLAQYVGRLVSDVKSFPWVGEVMKDVFSMMTCYHKSLPTAAMKFFDVVVSHNVTHLQQMVAGIVEWFQNNEPEEGNAGLWIAAVFKVYEAEKKLSIAQPQHKLDLLELSDGVVEMMLGLPDEYSPSKESVHCVCSMLEQLRNSCSKNNIPRLRSVLDWIIEVAGVSADDIRVAKLVFPDYGRAAGAMVAGGAARKPKAPPTKIPRRLAPPKPSSQPQLQAAVAHAVQAQKAVHKLSEHQIKNREAPPRPASAPIGPGGLGLAKKKTRVKVQPVNVEHKPHSPGLKVSGLTDAELTKRRLMPSVDDMFRHVISWSLEDIAAEKPDPRLIATSIPKSFKSAEEYQRVFEPLLLMEVRSALAAALTDQKTDDKPFQMDSSQLTRVDQCWTMRLCLSEEPTGPRKDRTLRSLWHEHDLLELSCASWKAPVIAVVRKLEWLEKERREAVTVMLRPPNSASMSFVDKKWKCGFLSSLVTAAREYRALASLQYLPKWRDFILRGDTTLLMGQHVPPASLPKVELLERQFNTSQAEAVLQCFQDTAGFLLVQGPPGTGKTKTVLGMIGAVLMAPPERRKRVLVCAASNRAVDEVALRMKDGLWDPFRNRMEKVSIVRIGREDVVNAELLPFTHEAKAKERCAARVSRADTTVSKNDEKIQSFKGQLEKLELLLKEAMDMATALKMANTENPSEKNQKACDKNQESIKTMLHSKREVRQHLKQATDDRTLALKNKQHDIASSKDEVIRDADVLFCTLSGAGHEALVSLNLDFDAVIVDEATQATELQTLIPLKYKSKLCVLVGDPKQLPATVISKMAQKSSYDQSLFQRLVLLGRPMHMLTVQYRMHPKICAFPNFMFYDHLLQNGSTVLSDRYTKSYHREKLFVPFLFCNCDSPESRDSGSSSTMNRGEANLATDLVIGFLRRFGVEAVPGGIAVITPYKRQMQLLQSMLRSRLSSEESKVVDVNTIDGFQGCEKDIVVFSCVRSHLGSSIGFLDDVRRLNVALTRARFCLIVLGNEKLLKQNEVFGELINHARIQNVLIEEADARLELLSGGGGGAGPRVKRVAPSLSEARPAKPSVAAQAAAPSAAVAEEAKPPAALFIPAAGDPINKELSNFNRKRDREEGGNPLKRSSTKMIVDGGKPSVKPAAVPPKPASAPPRQQAPAAPPPPSDQRKRDEVPPKRSTLVGDAKPKAERPTVRPLNPQQQGAVRNVGSTEQKRFVEPPSKRDRVDPKHPKAEKPVVADPPKAEKPVAADPPVYGGGTTAQEKVAASGDDPRLKRRKADGTNAETPVLPAAPPPLPLALEEGEIPSFHTARVGATGLLPLPPSARPPAPSARRPVLEVVASGDPWPVAATTPAEVKDDAPATRKRERDEGLGGGGVFSLRDDSPKSDLVDPRGDWRSYSHPAPPNLRPVHFNE